MNKVSGLYEKLTAYARTDACPFHMPGHKRNAEKFCFDNPFSFDITEIDGFDNLHHPTGILREAMERAASIYGSEKSYFLVNGSSGGILAAISACVKRKGEILVARNCHKSVYHGLILRELEPVYLCPPLITGWEINGEIRAEEVGKALEEHPEAEAVFLTSPTYEGICSDIKSIAEVVHSCEIPLIVDSAHGAHFAFRIGKDEKGFPASALESGADIVIESLHKTLPSLTQSAILHKKSNFVDEEKLEWYLQVYQSSSPSYVLMASIDSCISYMAGEMGKRDMKAYEENLDELRRRLASLNHVKIFRETAFYDKSKLVLRGEGISGPQLYEMLRERQMQPEMCTEAYVILMTSAADSGEVFHRLEDALVDIDKKISIECGKGLNKYVEKNTENSFSAAVFSPQVETEPADAMEQEKEICDIEACIGKISGEFAYIYPPGIPVLVPGERITKEILDILDNYRKSGLEILGLRDESGKTIKILK